MLIEAASKLKGWNGGSGVCHLIISHASNKCVNTTSTRSWWRAWSGCCCTPACSSSRCTSHLFVFCLLLLQVFFDVDVVVVVKKVPFFYCMEIKKRRESASCRTNPPPQSMDEKMNLQELTRSCSVCVVLQLNIVKELPESSNHRCLGGRSGKMVGWKMDRR